MIIYIHGFGGNGEGSKAKLFREYFKSIGEDFIAPSLSYVPQLAIQTLEELIASYHGDVYLIGSSLGGFYATYLSQMKEVKKVVLINPATSPIKTLKRAIGNAPNFYDSSYFKWDESHLKMLEKYVVEFPQGVWTMREQFMVLLQKGDELLDYRDAQKKYKESKLILEDGGSHSFDGIERHFENIRAYFAIGKHFKHTTKVKGVGFELEELAQRTGDLYYDNLAHFVGELAQKIKSDAIADKKRGRVKLAHSLFKSVISLQEGAKELNSAWQSCKVGTVRWMLDNGFNKDDMDIGVLSSEIAREFANRTRWDIASLSDHDTRYDLANFNDDFTQQMLGVFDEKGRAYIEYLKTYLRVITYGDFYPEDVPDTQEFIKEKCKKYGFLNEFEK